MRDKNDSEMFPVEELDLKLDCCISTGDVRVSESQKISFSTAHNHINTQRPAYGCIG
jgi:hypothetical protein